MHFLFEAGQSGFSLNLLPNGTIEKSAKGELSKRLVKQCAKQVGFRLAHPAFVVGEVVSQRYSESGFAFVMPFYRAETVTQYIDKSSAGDLRKLVTDIGDLVEELFRMSHPAELSSATIIGKTMDTVGRLHGTAYLTRIRRSLDAHLGFLNELPATLSVPAGPCHGDLTLANILFRRSDSRYILLDFLDVYFESPLHDLAKLAQETSLCWSSLVTQSTHDKMKYRVAMRFLRNHLNERFGNLESVRTLGHEMEYQTLLRVLPYTRNPVVADAVCQRLEALGASSVKRPPRSSG